MLFSKLATSLVVLGLSAFSAIATPAPVSTELQERNLAGDILNALGAGLVTQIHTYLTMDTFVDNYVSVDVGIENPLLLELTIDRIVSKAGLGSKIYATFDHKFPTPLVIGGKKAVFTGNIPKVLLVDGLDASADIVTAGYLDLIEVDVYLRAATIKGKLGIPLCLKGLKQAGVPTDYEFVF